jgi:hypothetical protein
MDLEQTRFLDFPGLQRYCHLVAGVVGEVAARIFGRTRPPRCSTRTAGPGDAADQHHPRRGRRRTARPHLPAGVRAAAVRRQGPRTAQARAPWGYSDRFTALMRFQAERAHATYDEALALLPEADRCAEAGADDGQHLPHAAARDRGRRASRCCTSAPRSRRCASCGSRAHPLARAGDCRPARRLAVVGAGWAGLAAAVRLVQAGARRHAVRDGAPARRPRAQPTARRHGLDNGQHILIGAYAPRWR